MRKMLLFTISLFLLLSLKLTAQNSIEDVIDNTKEHREIKEESKNHLLDGTFIKKTTLTRNVEYDNGYRPYRSNVNFSLNQISSPYFKVSDNANNDSNDPCFDSTLLKFNQLSRTLMREFDENFVLIEPIKKYYQTNQKNNFFSLEKHFSIDEAPSNCNKNKKYSVFPYSLRFYINPKDIEIIPRQNRQILDSNFVIPNKSELLQPFLFHKYEVTNEEYRGFVNWVRDSIAREMLYEEGSNGLNLFDYKQQVVLENGDTALFLNWEKEINWNGEEEKDILDFMFLPNYERFYEKKFIDSRKLMYKSKLIKTLNIYPDTMCWVNDFPYSFNEPLTNSYFWHPAYDSYPAVGVNYWQVKAFLDWKTKQHQKKLNKEGLALKITYSLPNDFQWDLVATANLNGDTVELIDYNYHNYSDKDWITNLKIKETHTTILDSIGKENKKEYYTTAIDKLYLLHNNANRFERNFIEDKSLQTAVVNINELN